MNKLSCFLLHVSGPLAAKVWQLFACSVACRAAIRNLSIPSIRFCLFGVRGVPFCMISHTRRYNQIHVQSLHLHVQSAWVHLFVCSPSEGSGNVEHWCLDKQFFNGTVCWQTTKQLAVTLRCRTPSMAEQSV